MTNLSKRQRVLLIVGLILAALLIAGGIFTWNKFFREEPQVFANEDEHFKYGSLGADLAARPAQREKHSRTLGRQ